MLTNFEMSNKKEIDNYEILFFIEAFYPGTRSLSRFSKEDAWKTAQQPGRNNFLNQDVKCQ